ncbi:hypothetical protein BDF21DRAFT_17427 [Thamnidium elegans]|nr:hypothetical protein BDF21DRAFT_17427 [Thamnidium elegans]
MQQNILPAEILQQIFEELSINDLFKCQFVCHSWHIAAKRNFYKDVEFKTSFGINLFLTCIHDQNKALSIPSPGIFVKRLFFNHSPKTAAMQSLGVGSTLSSQHFQALAIHCPNVTTVDCTQNLNNVIVTALLSLPEDVKWDKLESFPDGNRISLELYKECAYKFRSSLTTLYFGAEPLSYLSQFPCLCVLDMTNCPITCIDELEYILNTCTQLEQLVLTLKGCSSEARQLSRQVYSSLKLLKLKTEDDQFEYMFLRYIMYKFNSLVSLEAYGMNLLDISLKDEEEYTGLIQWINSLKSAELILRGYDYNMVPQVASTYLSGIFKTQAQHMEYDTTLNIHNTNHTMTNTNNITFLVFSTMPINEYCMQRDIDIQLPQFETDDRLIHANYISQFSPFVNEIFITYEGTPIYTRGCSHFLDSIIEQCTTLRSVNVNYSDLDITTNSVNETITDFAISNSQISIDFFPTLSFSCPNLKNLTLHRNFHSRTSEYAVYIDIPHTDLDVLSLLGEIQFPWISTLGGNDNPGWIIMISTTHQKRHFKIDGMTALLSEIKQEYLGYYCGISIGINCRGIKKFRISALSTDTCIDLS